jgi:mono/diheme cytochrome c family protein
MKRLPWRRILKWTGISVAVLLLAIQFIPYGRDHSNPPVGTEPDWDSPRTRELAVVACFDCHSNQTEWPWYSNVAPVSWLTQRDVDEGRSALNFSDWNGQRQEIDEAVETIEEGEMPPWYYLPTHRDADLSDAEKEELIAGFRATFGSGLDD